MNKQVKMIVKRALLLAGISFGYLQAQDPNFEMWNQLDKPIYYGLVYPGKDPRTDGLSRAVDLQVLKHNKSYQRTLDTSGVIRMGFSVEDPRKENRKVQLYSLDAEDKTLYLTAKEHAGKVYVVPQRGSLWGTLGFISGTRHGGLSVANNITLDGITFLGEGIPGKPDTWTIEQPPVN